MALLSAGPFSRRGWRVCCNCSIINIIWFISYEYNKSVCPADVRNNRCGIMFHWQIRHSKWMNPAHNGFLSAHTWHKLPWNDLKIGFCTKYISIHSEIPGIPFICCENGENDGLCLMFDYHFPAYLLHWYDCLMHLPTFTVKCSWQSQNIAKFHLAERWPNKSPLARLSFRSIFWLLSEKPIWFNITDKMLTIYHNLVLWWTACDGINFVAFTNRSTAQREKSKRRMEIFITNAYYAFSDCHECTGKRYKKADWMGWPSFMQRGKWWINVKWIFERSPPSMHTPHIRPCQHTCVCLPFGFHIRIRSVYFIN